MTSDQAKAYIYTGGAIVAAYLLYRVLTGASKVAGAVGDAVGTAAGAVDTTVAAGVGGIGYVFGLPTPGQTIDDPAVVRYIIDTQGQFEASKQGTAWAYIKANTMAPGSGHPAGTTLTADQMKNVTTGMPVMTVPQTDQSGSILSGPSFNDLKDNPWGWY